MGYGERIRNYVQLAEHIAAGENDAALMLLCDMQDFLGIPAQIKRRVAMRAAEPATRLDDPIRPAPAIQPKPYWTRIRGSH